MSRIEELPDDFDDSLQIDPASSSSSVQANPKPTKVLSSNETQSISLPTPNGSGSQQGKDSTTPALPPPMDSIKSRTPAEVLANLNRTPLFMTSLDDTDGAAGENNELEALKALAYEGTPAEVAENFREQGNECFRAKKWTDAVEFYTKGIVVLQEAKKKKQSKQVAEGERVSESEVEQERGLEEACLVNRAACNLEMSAYIKRRIRLIAFPESQHLTQIYVENYRRTTTDCAAVLLLNPSNVKAWYRSARACLALDKIPAALDACSRGLEIDPESNALKGLSEKIMERKAFVEGKERQTKEREERQKAEERALRLALKARNISTRTTAKPPETEDATIHLSPDSLSPTSILNLPVLLLYPLQAQTDFIKSYPETTSLAEHLSYILPPPWDDDHEYGMENVECYMETKTGGLVKVGKKMALAKILGSGKVEIVDGVVRLFVVPKTRAEGWIEVFKQKKGGIGAGS
ncbi:MAG: hypothetical protein M1812_007331 [Candelaria pacifica]|nr:MAG: hypothetical protein M1812_007331 [Candelaria pacifica]